jgi:hypothetical protein
MMPETYVIEYEVTDELVEPAVDSLMAWGGGNSPAPDNRGCLIPSIVLVLLTVLLVSFGIANDLGWLYFLVAGSPIAFLIFYFGLFRSLVVLERSQRNLWRGIVRNAFDLSEPTSVRWTISAEGLRVDERTGTREIDWADVKELFLGQDFWVIRVRPWPSTMLFYGRAATRAAACYVIDHVRREGGSVRQDTTSNIHDAAPVRLDNSLFPAARDRHTEADDPKSSS